MKERCGWWCEKAGASYIIAEWQVGGSGWRVRAVAEWERWVGQSDLSFKELVK